MSRSLPAVMALAVLLSGALFADSIIYIKSTGQSREQALIENVTITAWSASRVEYRGEGGRAQTVPAIDVVTINRTAPGMSNELSRAIENLAADPAAARESLARIASTGNALDKEEAAYWRARSLANESNGSAGNIAAAITELQNYLRAYKAGFFAREIYATQAELQQRAKRTADARATLKAMIAADAALVREGNQLLGQFELNEGKINDAITAFQAARAQAGRDRYKAGEYLAQAWEGWATAQKEGAEAAARTLLAAVIADEKFEDNTTLDDEIALSVAWPALGDIRYEAGDFSKAYDAYIKAGYYSWWTQGTREGYSIGRAYLCARKQEAAESREEAKASWKARRDKLRTALALGFPQELQRVEKEG